MNHHYKDQKWFFCFSASLGGYHHVQVSEINIDTRETAVQHKQGRWLLFRIKQHVAVQIITWEW
jgi:hypothetical protein